MNSELDKTVDARAERVKSKMSKSTELILEVSIEVAEAKYELSKDEYNEFLTKTNLTIAVADKLRKVAQCKNLHLPQFKKHLNRIDGWTTLYEITKLRKSDLDTFLMNLDAQPELNVSRETINSFRTGQSTPTNARSQNDKIRVCQIFISRIDVQRLDFKMFESIKTKLDDIKRMIDRSPQAVTVEVNDTEIQHLEKTYFNSSLQDAEPEPDIENETLSDPQQSNQVSFLKTKENMNNVNSLYVVTEVSA